MRMITEREMVSEPWEWKGNTHAIYDTPKLRTQGTSHDSTLNFPAQSRNWPGWYEDCFFTCLGQGNTA